MSVINSVGRDYVSQQELYGDIRASMNIVNGGDFTIPGLCPTPSVPAKEAEVFSSCPPTPPSTACLVGQLRQSIHSLPQDTFIESVVSMSYGCTNVIQEARDELVAMARKIPGCPKARTITRRKNRFEADETFNRRLSIDCYKLLQFIEGSASHDIADVFRAPPQSQATLTPRESSTSRGYKRRS